MVLCFIPRDFRGDTTNGRPEKSILDRKPQIAIFTTNLNLVLRPPFSR